jgi:hypothetical protein
MKRRSSGVVNRHVRKDTSCFNRTKIRSADSISEDQT